APEPPPTTICLPVQTAAGCRRAMGALVVEVNFHVLATGSYRPPVLSNFPPSNPPHTIIWPPAQTALCWLRAGGTPFVVVGLQVSADGSYRPPVGSAAPLLPVPPHTRTSRSWSSQTPAC